MKNIQSKICNLNGEFNNAIIEIIDNKHEVEISLLFDQTRIRESDTFPFIALQRLNKYLEDKNMKLMVKGCRRDVHPSGAFLIGFNAYMLTMGKQASRTEIVNIFEPESNIEAIGTVEEQNKYYKDWLNSLKNRD